MLDLSAGYLLAHIFHFNWFRGVDAGPVVTTSPSVVRGRVVGKTQPRDGTVEIQMRVAKKATGNELYYYFTHLYTSVSWQNTNFAAKLWVVKHDLTV